MKQDEHTDFVHKDFKHVVAHAKGFSESDIKETFEGGGLGDVSYAYAFDAKIQGQPDSRIFIARGIKAT